MRSIVSQIRNDDDDDEFVTMRSENHFLVMKNPTQLLLMLLLFTLEWSTSSCPHMEETRRKHEKNNKKIIFLHLLLMLHPLNVVISLLLHPTSLILIYRHKLIFSIEQCRIVSRYYFFLFKCWMQHFCVSEQSWSSCLSIFKYTIYTTQEQPARETRARAEERMENIQKKKVK